MSDTYNSAFSATFGWEPACRGAACCDRRDEKQAARLHPVLDPGKQRFVLEAPGLDNAEGHAQMSVG